uniref:Cytochrome P450 n=1 Tax=Oryza brachyantha TaxID=4533 RepID=J3LCQ3_ORYBR
MELFYFYYGCTLCLLFALLLVRHGRATKQQPRRRLPPGPWQLPIVGSLHHLVRGLPPHAMRDLALRHGPLMLLRVCERVMVVVSSAEAAREIFKGHDAAFSERPSSPGIDELNREGQGIIFAPYGDHWRLLRRIVMTELLTPRRVESFREQFIADSAVRAIFGDMLPDRAAFLRMVKQGTELSSLFDLRDLFPSSRLARLLASWSGGKAERHRQEMFRLMDDILRQHDGRKAAAGDGDEDEHVDMVDVLLRIQSQGNMRVSLTRGVIRTFLGDVLGAALETSTTTLQWAIADLMANPRVMQKAQQEVRQAFADQAKVDEAGLSKLRYLKAVIKETLRLHPPAPFFPRVCLEDRTIQGYDLPRGTIVLTNAWAISRDPRYWADPEEYSPERFEEGGGGGGRATVDFRGSDFEFTPFGAGRRICPGMNFSHVNVELALASLLFHFDWELPPGAEPEKLDMTEQLGITMRRKSKLSLRLVPYVPL